MASLEERIRTAAADYAPLMALLGSGSPVVFRFYDTTPPQGFSYPAIVMMMVSNPPSYSLANRMQTSYALVQFTVWGGLYSAGVSAAEAVANALIEFLDQQNFAGSPAARQMNNFVVENKRAAYTQKDTVTYQRLITARIFSDETL